ncbi:MAG: hypothetical protein GYA86_05915 [Firmicutes bacterium]|nr:hypothetical protein [Bacillota bacterium]
MGRELKSYTRKERNYYLLGLTGQNMVYNVIGVGLALYYTEALYVPPRSGRAADAAGEAVGCLQ